MQIFLVGGSVRDELLGLPVTDRDWVVVNSSPDEMLALGFKQVGKDFPVFLHPQTNEEYALARIERKIGPGYYGFECIFSKKVTLTEDLQRRDLTINAIAKSRDGIIIDPFGGQDDLNKRLLRHVSAAFAEDPVRVLRVARFLAKFFYLGFSVAAPTIELMRQMVAGGELHNLVKERVWSEMVKALKTSAPEQFFILLNEVQALAIIAPELVTVDLALLKRVAGQHLDVMIRFGAFAHGFKDEQHFVTFAQHMQLPNEFKKFGLLCVRYKTVPLAAVEIYTLFKELRIYSVGGVAALKQYLQACDGQLHQERLLAAYECSLAVNATIIQGMGFTGAEITAELDSARIKLLNNSTYTKK